MPGAKIPPALADAQVKAPPIKVPQAGTEIRHQFEGSTLKPEPVIKGEPALQTVNARALLQNIAAALGFPKDNLSVALIAFSRFFSLSPDPALITYLRQELLSLQRKTQRPSGTGEISKQDTLGERDAMAAIIAADKGVRLSPEALERYSRYLLPPEPVDSDENRPEQKENPLAEEMRKMAEEQAKKDKLLDILNSLPGKNRQYWKVFPFAIKVREAEFNIIVRIFNGEILIIDITGPKRQWRCFLKKTDGNVLADIQVYPEYSERALASLRKRAESFFGKGVSLENGDKFPSWVEYLLTEPLPSVDEEV